MVFYARSSNHGSAPRTSKVGGPTSLSKTEPIERESLHRTQRSRQLFNLAFCRLRGWTYGPTGEGHGGPKEVLLSPIMTTSGRWAAPRRLPWLIAEHILRDSTSIVCADTHILNLRGNGGAKPTCRTNNFPPSSTEETREAWRMRDIRPYCQASLVLRETLSRTDIHGIARAVLRPRMPMTAIQQSAARAARIHLPALAFRQSGRRSRRRWQWQSEKWSASMLLR
ncbi:hypothetical protein FHX16_006053 [Rhizobium sp. BK661]|nr:hypothetical protein [Rhizobium sp. BK661]